MKSIFIRVGTIHKLRKEKKNIFKAASIDYILSD